MLGVSTADFGDDGDEDLLVTNIDAPPTLLRNDQTTANRWLRIRLLGTSSNRDGIGARVNVTSGALASSRTVTTTAEYLSSGDPTLTFGLGRSETAAVEVRWPSGIVMVRGQARQAAHTA